MEVGTELSVQIKKAIKAKLQEMQCYVDDELPDYIMVMIANKKSTDQMAEDLKIFLSEGSVSFCKWLGEVLERLDKVGKDAPEEKKQEKKTTPRRSRSSSKGKRRRSLTPRKQKSKSKSPKPSKRIERGRKTNTAASNRRVVDVIGSRRKSNIEERGERKRTIHIDKEKRVSPSGEENKKPRKSSSSEDKNLLTKKKEKAASPVNERSAIPEYKKTGRTIVIRNEYSEEVTESKSNVAIDTLREASPLSSEENEVLNRKSDSDTEKNEANVATIVSPVITRKVSPAPKIEQKIVAKVSPMMSVVDTESSILMSPPKAHVKERLGPRRGPEGRKTGIVKPLVVASKDDAADSKDLRQRLEIRQGQRLKAAAGREKIVSRKGLQMDSKLEPDLKTLNTIFNKAMNDVKTVEVSAKAKKSVEEYDPLQPDIRRKRAHMLKMPRVTVQNENAEVEILRLAAKRTRKRGSISKKRHYSASEISSNDGDRHGKRKKEETPKRSKKRHSESPNSDSEKTKATKFVVSLKGATKFIEKVRKLGKKSASDSELDQDSNSESEYENEGSGSDYNDESFNEDDDVDDSPKKNVSLYKKQASEGVSNEMANDKKEEQEMNLERCRFWPACKLGDKCGYVHPTKPCSKFPQCAFGESCLFIHPHCKFGQNCTNFACGFSHAGGRKVRQGVPKFPSSSYNGGVVPNVMQKEPTKPPAETVCKYSTQCKLLSCPFMHPKIMKDCAFGVSCRRKNKGCKYLHGASISKFKWSSSVKNSSELTDKRAELKSC
ncbi:zinc finger CCCH domain-containing protein 14-like [Symsagittifera roscoffensis]|uniref:zinc finger CCCH domain-containing protein 14-like n=1 Tax=Symsagittifera roscoffensis TaxID=84072 RepID=UPI00307BDD80